MSIQSIGGRPTGILGRAIGHAMNRSLTPLYLDYVAGRLPADGSVIVDLGCGGGRFIRELHDRNRGFRLVGIDHSPEMVQMARRVNRHRRREETNRPSIVHGSVDRIEVDSDSVDLATAFETVQFWPDTDGAFREILRVLRPGGRLIIMNRYPEEGTTWWRLARIKDAGEYADRLTAAGFADVSVDLRYRKGWIAVTAGKVRA